MIPRQLNRTTKDAKRIANKLLIQLEGDVSDYKGRCLFMVGDKGEYCKRTGQQQLSHRLRIGRLDGLEGRQDKKGP